MGRFLLGFATALALCALVLVAIIPVQHHAPKAACKRSGS